jgi:membrane protein DedA with SNARE-associated domain
MEHLIARFGPIAVLVGAAIEYDGTLILAGVVVHLGLIAFPVAVAAGGVGALLGDSVFFGAGRRGGAGVRRSSAYTRVASFVEELATRTGPWEIVLARFVYGTRIASMFFWGLRGLGWVTFVTLDLVGGLLGAIILVTLGFVFSQSATAVLGDVERVEKRLLGGALVAALAVLCFHVLARRVRAARSLARSN